MELPEKSRNRQFIVIGYGLTRTAGVFINDTEVYATVHATDVKIGLPVDGFTKVTVEMLVKELEIVYVDRDKE